MSVQSTLLGIVNIMACRFRVYSNNLASSLCAVLVKINIIHDLKSESMYPVYTSLTYCTTCICRLVFVARSNHIQSHSLVHAMYMNLVLLTVS